MTNAVSSENINIYCIYIYLYTGPKILINRANGFYREKNLQQLRLVKLSKVKVIQRGRPTKATFRRDSVRIPAFFMYLSVYFIRYSVFLSLR